MCREIDLRLVHNKQRNNPMTTYTDTFTDAYECISSDPTLAPVYEFIHYCFEKYGIGGTYHDSYEWKIPTTLENVATAVAETMISFGGEFEMDSFGAEQVRDYLIGSSDIRGTMFRGLPF